MQNIKLHYLKLLGKIKSGTWGAIYTTLYISRSRRIPQNNSIDDKGNALRTISSIGPGIQAKPSISQIHEGKPLIKMMSEQIVSTPIPREQEKEKEKEKEMGNCAIYVSTKDAYTLTDGPTIFLAEDVEKVARFCIQQSNIPSIAMDAITEKIEFNNRVNAKIDELENELEHLEEKNSMKEIVTAGGASHNGKNYSKKDDSKKKNNIPNETNKDANKINSELDSLR